MQNVRNFINTFLYVQETPALRYLHRMRSNIYRSSGKTSSFQSARKNSKEHFCGISNINAIERFRVLMAGINIYSINATRVPEAFLVLPNLLWLVLPLGRTRATRVESGSLISFIEIQALFVHVVSSLGIDLCFYRVLQEHISVTVFLQFHTI